MKSKLRRMITDKGSASPTCRRAFTDRGEMFEYRMMIKSRGCNATDILSQHLRGLPEVTEFRISPTGD